MAEDLLPTAMMIALIGFMEAISVAKAIASRHKYEVNANRELVALGASNLSAFFTGAYPVTGGFSRSAVNDQAGARTPLASLITAAGIAISLLFLTPLFYAMPKAVLASIVMVAVSSLIDFKAPLRLWHVRRSDAALLALTFISTLAVGIGQGILIGVLVSLGAFIHRSTRPHTAELGRIPGTNVFRNLKNFPDAEPLPGVLMLRMDASFYFANVAYFRDRLEAFLRDAPDDVDIVLLDASSMNDLDSSAEAALRETVRKLRTAGKDMVFANVKGPVKQVMQRSGLWDYLGEDHVFLTLELAAAGLAELRTRRGQLPIEEEQPVGKGFRPPRFAEGANREARPAMCPPRLDLACL
jgi:SulP family sulfate permease